MQKTQFVTDLSPKDSVNTVFIVKYIAVMESRDGKSYLNIILADSKGDIEGRKWSAAKEVADKVKAGDYVEITGKVNSFQSRFQVIVNKINKIDASQVNPEDFEVKSENSPEKMYEELTTIVNGLEDVYIRDLLQGVLFDSEISRRLKIWPAGKSIHHAYKSGLLEHILSCSNLAVSLSPHYGVNTSYVVAGAILHDLCKIYELTDGPVVEYTEEGKLIGHLVKGLEIVDRFASRVKNFPYQTKTHLKHILLSHHGEYEYGSPKIPQTSEAFLVHLIDFMDSKMHSLETIKRNDKQSGHWSGFVKHLDRIVFKKALPSHTEYITDEALEKTKESKEKREPSNNKGRGQTDLKQSMASLLKDINLSGEE